MKKMFLTGGSGMVGRNLLEHAAISDWDVYAPTSRELDLTDSRSVLEYIERVKPDIIVHTAGKVGGIQANIDAPVSFLDDNILMGRNVVMGGATAGVKQLLNLASTCIYPASANNPLSEDLVLSAPLEPTNEGYALAKIATLRLCQYIRREQPSFLYKTIIPCNLYGRYDKFDPINSHLLPAIIQKVHNAKISSKRQIEIWGDGLARREFMSCGELADIIILACANLQRMPDLMNAGIGRDYSVLEYYERVSKVVGWKGEFTFDMSKPVGMRQKLCDTSKLNSFGWKPKISLDDGVRIAYDYFLEVN